jgi:pimeloyl-ACP methyl ester carboxylesterase
MFGIFPASVQAEAVAFAFFASNSQVAGHWLHGWYPLAGLAQGNATAKSVYDNWGDGGVAPMVILQPLEDAAAAEGAAMLKQQFPQRVTVYPIENAGHALMPEQPEQVQQLILQSLQQWSEQ